MDQKFYDAMEASPVVAAVKDMEGVRNCCNIDEIKVVFILFGDVCSICDIVKQVKESKKIAIVHVDLIEGLSTKEIVVDFIKDQTHADGIITTRPTLIKRAKQLSLFTILRFFIIDSRALKNVEHQYGVKPDFIEILPGMMPKIIKRICASTNTPVIAGGLVSDKEDVMNALGAGAMSVSTSNEEVWLM